MDRPVRSEVQLRRSVRQGGCRLHQSTFAPETLTTLAHLAIPSGISGTEFAKFMAAETAKWAKVVKVSGAKVD